MKTKKRDLIPNKPQVTQFRPSSSFSTYAVTFLILYMRFMFMPISAYSMFLQVLIIIILLVLPSDEGYFTQKFVGSRIAVLLILAFFVGAEDTTSPSDS